MEKEKQENIEYNKNLLIKKYKSMYKKHNNYHPSNLKITPIPPSLKFSSGTQNYYELLHQNLYLGNKIKQIQSGTGNYNCNRYLKDYQKWKELGNKIASRSKYKNKLVDLISPLAYEKRLNKMIEERYDKRRISTPSITRGKRERSATFYGTHNNFYNNMNKIQFSGNVNGLNIDEEDYMRFREKYLKNTKKENLKTDFN